MAEDEDPRAALDKLIDDTGDQNQWFAKLDARGDELADERKMDIVEWMLLDYAGSYRLEKQSGFDLSAIANVAEHTCVSMYLLSGEERQKAESDVAGTVAAIHGRQRRGIRTNIALLVNYGNRADTFLRIARAQRSGLVEQSDPDFQWHVIADKASPNESQVPT